MQDMSFEQAMERLEKITAELSREGITLEESLALYEEGVALARICNRYLEDTERKIKMLQISSDGEIEEKNFSENTKEILDNIINKIEEKLAEIETPLDEGYSRNNLISRIRNLGYNYNFSRYTDAQIFRV